MKREAQFHSRSRHHGQYDFKQLCASTAELKPFIVQNQKGEDTIDFSDNKAVKLLNTALLKTHYNLEFWDIPEGYLCPPIPGRAEYIHQIADLIKDELGGKPKVTCLDIGVGANCIYSIIAASQYKWNCIGSEIDPVSVESAAKIAASNSLLKDKIDIRHQPNPDNLFAGVIKKNERIDIVICNPPFYKSRKDAEAATARKNKNLHQSKKEAFAKNFGGMDGELFCEGGEVKFITKMIRQSEKYAKNCTWFSCLVSKGDHMKKFHKVMKDVNPKEYQVVEMHFGNKKSRILAWRF